MSQGIVVNPEQLVALKAVFTDKSQAVHDVSAQITSQLENTEWRGNVADNFRRDWAESYAPSLGRLVEALHAAGADVQNALARALAADNQG